VTLNHSSKIDFRNATDQCCSIVETMITALLEGLASRFQQFSELDNRICYSPPSPTAACQSSVLVEMVIPRKAR